MRRGTLLLLTLIATGSGAPLWAQDPVAPITSIENSLVALRAQTDQLGELLVGARLHSPTDLHDLAGILGSLAVTLDRMATHAEHGQITAAQREALEAEIETSRLMLEQLSERIRALALP
jgi:hypothetical protein